MPVAGALQTTKTMGNGTATYQGAYSQLVSQVGNKTRELELTSSATGNVLSELTTSCRPNRCQSGRRSNQSAALSASLSGGAKSMQIAASYSTCCSQSADKG